MLEKRTGIGEQMRRRDLITLIGGAAAWPVVACAQNRDRIPRIAVLWRANLDRQTGINILLFQESVLLPPICRKANPQKSSRSWPMSRVRDGKNFVKVTPLVPSRFAAVIRRASGSA